MDVDILDLSLNNQHHAIKFAVEEQKDGKISIFNVLVDRSSSRVHTSVYCKKTHTDCYININWSY